MAYQHSPLKFPRIRLLVLVGIALSAAVLAKSYGNLHGDIDSKSITLLGTAVFVVFAVAGLHVVTGFVRKHSMRNLGAMRASQLQFLLRLGGYTLIFMVMLGLLTVPVGKLLFGGAAIGVILGVASQQSLANFFAGITLMISRPFTIGDHITIKAGNLGGDYKCEIIDMSLAYVRIKCEDGTLVLLPNAGVLAGAIVLDTPHSHATVTTQRVVSKADSNHPNTEKSAKE